MQLIANLGSHFSLSSNFIFSFFFFTLGNFVKKVKLMLNEANIDGEFLRFFKFNFINFKVGLMLNEADIDGDGKIDFQEFSRLLRGLFLPQGPQVKFFLI